MYMFKEIVQIFKKILLVLFSKTQVQFYFTSRILLNFKKKPIDKIIYPTLHTRLYHVRVLPIIFVKIMDF